MKSRAIQIIVLLALGAVVNVAVAWGCISWPEPPDGRREIYGRFGSGECCLAIHRRFGVSRLDVHYANTDRGMPLILNNCPSWSSRSIQYPEMLRGVTQGEFETQTLEACGWPFLTLSNETVSDGTTFTIVQGMPWDKWPADRQSDLVLPIRPIWPGFAINTIFYAAMLGVMFFAPGMVKRTLRRRRGLCPACAYPIGTSSVCSECGKPVLPRLAN